ncbi:MAG: protein kinase [Armatimonadetes bacterium]|nr:protein kinase [Armatimonadota bacterium]
MPLEDSAELKPFALDLPCELGRYRLEAEIGRGGMGIVYLAHDTLLDRPVAIKVLLPQLAADAQFVQRFTREAQMAARLEHPSIVTVHDVGEAKSLVYFVMRMVIGKPLDRLLSEGLTWADAEPIAMQVADGISYAHGHGVVHRDIKPENVIVSDDGVVTITDFGLARPETQTKGGPTQAGAILGTPDYMSPEQAMGDEVDARADIYSYGVMLYEMLCGHPPFTGNSAFAVINQHINTVAPRVRNARADVPAYLDELVARCLEKDRDKRPATMTEVRDILSGQVGALSEAQETTTVGHDIVARVRRGEVALATAIHDFPDETEHLDKIFRRELTAVSLDLAGSTKLKQTGGGTVALGAVFNRYRELVDTALRSNDVVDVVWAGDGTVALFTLPSQAVSAAQQVITGLRVVNTEFTDTPPLEVRIGIHTGSILRDPNQTLGQVTSRTLDITGHLQKDAQPGLVEISEVTLDKLTTHEGFVPLRKDRDGGLMVYAWHPDGAEHVPQGWMQRLVRGVNAGGTSSTKKSGEQAAKPTRETRPEVTKPSRTTKGGQLACFYCKAPVRVQDQNCPSCGRLNRHFDPNVDDKGRRRKPAAATPPPAKPAAREKAPPRTAERKPTARDRVVTRRDAGPERKPWERDDRTPAVWSDLVTGVAITVVAWVIATAVLKQFAWFYMNGRPRDAVAFAPLAIIGLLALSDFSMLPMRAFGMILGMPLTWLLLKSLGWLGA